MGKYIHCIMEIHIFTSLFNNKYTNKHIHYAILQIRYEHRKTKIE